MALITCQNLCLGYDGREIIHELSFEVNNGDYLCIVGETVPEKARSCGRSSDCSGRSPGRS